MNKLLFVTFILVTLSLNVSAKWTGTLRDPDGNTENEIQKGIFKRFLVEFTSDSTKPDNAKASLSLDTEKSTTGVTWSTKAYVIDTFISKTVEIYIGVPCLFDGDNVVVEFSFTGEQGDKPDQFEIIDKKTISIIDSTKPEIMWEPITLNPIPMHSYAKVLVDPTTLNVDPLTFSFTSDINNDQDVYIEELVLQPFEFQRSKTTLIYGSKIVTADYTLGKTTQKFTRQVESECFSVSTNPIVFEVSNSQVAELTQDVKEAMIDSIDMEKAELHNKIAFTVAVQQFPVILTCVCQRNEMPLLLNDVLRNLGEVIENDDLKVFQHFIDDAKKQEVVFENISRLGDYRIKCLVDNTSNDMNTVDRYNNNNNNNNIFSSLEFTIGEFESADVRKKVMYHDNLTFGACATWEFEATKSPEELTDFSYKAMYFCNNEIEIAHPNLIFWENGCMRCIVRDMNYLPGNSSSICFVPKTTCNSEYIYDAFVDFESVVEKIRDNAGIYKELNVEYNVKSFKKEFDSIQPDYQKFTFTRTEVQSEFIRFTASYTGDQATECIFKKPKIEIIEHISITDIKSNGVHYTLHPGKTINIDLNFMNSGISKDILNIMVVCYNLPGSNSQLKSTGAFRGLTFLKLSQINADDEPKTKPDCNTEPTNRQCISSFGHKPYTFKSTNPLKDKLSLYDYFNFLTSPEQTTWIDTELTTSTDWTVESIIEHSVLICTWLSKRNCMWMNDYDKCRSHKKVSYEAVRKQYDLKINKNNFIEVIKGSDNDAPRLIKTFALSLFGFTNIADVYDYEDYSAIYDFIEAVANKGNEWLDIISQRDASAVVDVASVLITSSFNWVDFITYGEADFKITEINNKTQMITSKLALQQRRIAQKAMTLLFDLNVDSIDYESFNYKYFQKILQLSNLVDADPDVIAFEGLNIEIKILPNILMNKYGGKYLQVFGYQKYPLVSLNNKKISNHFVGFRMYDDNKKLIPVLAISKNMRPTVWYNMKYHNDEYKECKIYNEMKGATETSGITTEAIKGDVDNNNNNNNNNYTQCTLSMFGDITIGEKSSGSLLWLYIGLGSLVFIILLSLWYFIYTRLAKRNNAIPILDQTSASLMQSDD